MTGNALAADLDLLAAATGFSGAVRVDRGDEVVLARAYGLAHRGHRIANTVDTRFAIASGTKGLTALTVVSLIEGGVLDRATTARSVLGGDLPLVDDDVTVEHLLGHRSGIGDYADEESDGVVTDHLPVPVHELATTEQYLRVLDGYPRKFRADARFAYSNSGYVVLALIAERAAATPFPDLVAERVCVPAGMTGTGFPRSDEPGPDTALGYLDRDGLRTNVFHLPVRGSGDGGACSTAADLHRLWTALFAGRIVSRPWVTELTTPRSKAPALPLRYGLGFWLPEQGGAMLEGYDAGVSFRTTHHPGTGLTSTVLANTTEGAWPMARHLESVPHR